MYVYALMHQFGDRVKRADSLKNVLHYSVFEGQIASCVCEELSEISIREFCSKAINAYREYVLLYFVV